jgi:hypothetical protein
MSEVSDTIGTIVDIAKRIKNYELVKEVGELQRMTFELFAENSKLRSELEVAKRDNDFNAKTTFRDGVYWVDGDDTPFCARCWEADRKMIHLQTTDWGGYICPEELYREKK